MALDVLFLIKNNVLQTCEWAYANNYANECGGYNEYIKICMNDVENIYKATCVNVLIYTYFMFLPLLLFCLRKNFFFHLRHKGAKLLIWIFYGGGSYRKGNPADDNPKELLFIVFAIVFIGGFWFFRYSLLLIWSLF